MISLCSPPSLGTHPIDKAALKLPEISQMLGLKATTATQLLYNFLIF